MIFAKRSALMALLLFSLNTLAEETDQFTLPPVQLVDIGPSVSRRLADVIEDAMTQTNADISALQARPQQNQSTIRKLAERRSDAWIADIIYSKTGVGLPESTFERWLRRGRFPSDLQPMRYSGFWPWKTVYWLVFSQCPGSLLILSPTINMYGHYIGTDKIGHFFQQGNGYYKLYTRALARGKTPEQAHADMIRHGQRQEDGLFGTLLNGIYSNADLSGNYAGWKFYMNLAHTVTIGDRKLPPIIELNGGKWTFRRGLDKDNLLKPYINDNLNEAWNPSHYFFTRSMIRHNIKRRCGEWEKRVGLNQDMVQSKLAETQRWQGEDYGHWLPARDAVTLDVCFAGR